MKHSRTKARGVLFLSIAIVCGGCGLVAEPTAELTGAKLQGITATDATMLFDVKVSNPYPTALPLGNLDYALTSRGQKFASGKADVQGEVPAGGSKTLGVPVRISYLELMRAVEGVRPGSTVPYTADLGLSVDTALGAMRLPMSRDGKLTIPTAPSLLERLKDLGK